jgi:hypothetical protein
VLLPARQARTCCCRHKQDSRKRFESTKALQRINENHRSITCIQIKLTTQKNKKSLTGGGAPWATAPAVVLALQLLVATTHGGVPSRWAAALARLVAARPQWQLTASLWPRRITG